MSVRLCPLTVVLLFGAIAGLAGTAEAQSPDSTTLRDTVSLSPKGNVEIHNQTGRITVTTWDRSEVGYEVTFAPAGNDEALVQDPVVNHSDRELSFGVEDSWSLEIPGILTISPSGTSEPIGRYRVVMPTTATLEIDDHGSTIDVSRVEGPVDINTHAGSVTVRGAERQVTLDTFSGAITATGLRNNAELETHSGRITAVFDSVSGPSTAETHSGALRVFLPADAAFTLKTDADSSRIAVDAAFGTPARNGEHWAFHGGGDTLSVETFSGSVEVRPLDSWNASP